MNDSLETIPAPVPESWLLAPGITSMDLCDFLALVFEVSKSFYHSSNKLRQPSEVSAKLLLSQNAIELLLRRHRVALSIKYINLTPRREMQALVRTIPGEKRKRHTSNEGGCSAGVVCDLVCHVITYAQQLVSCGFLRYSELRAYNQLELTLFIDAKSDGFVGYSGKVSTVSLHFPQALQPQAHTAWLPIGVMLGKDSEANNERLFNTIPDGESCSLAQRLIALGSINFTYGDLCVPINLMLTSDYACLRGLFHASRSNYAVPKANSRIYLDEDLRANSEYFGVGCPSVWCDATPAAINSGAACAMSDPYQSVTGIFSDMSYPGLLHLCTLGVAGAISDAGKALRKLLNDHDADRPAVAAIPLLRGLFRDASGFSKTSWDIFDEEPHPNARAKSFHRAEHTNVTRVIDTPAEVIAILDILNQDDVVTSSVIGRKIIVVISNAMDIARGLAGRSPLGCEETVRDTPSALMIKGKSLDEFWVDLCAYHHPHDAVAEYNIPGTRFLPAFCAHNIAAHLFAQHVGDVLRILSCRKGGIRRYWETGGEHLNNLVAVLWCDARVGSVAFAKRASRILQLAILNVFSRCHLRDDDNVGYLPDVVCRSYV